LRVAAAVLDWGSWNVIKCTPAMPRVGTDEHMYRKLKEFAVSKNLQVYEERKREKERPV
jgi:hypothetical protein